MQNWLTPSLRYLREKPGLHVADVWSSRSGIITGQWFATQLKGRSTSVTRKEGFPHISCCLFQCWDVLWGSTSAWALQEEAALTAVLECSCILWPLLVTQHPLKFCSQGPKVKYTFFNPLLTPPGATFLRQGHCRQFPSLAGSLWDFSFVGKGTLFMGSRDGLLAVPGVLQKEPNIINLAQSASLPVNSLTPAGKAEQTKLFFPFSPFF